VTAASNAVASTPAVTGLLRFTVYQLPRYRRTSRPSWLAPGATATTIA